MIARKHLIVVALTACFAGAVSAAPPTQVSMLAISPDNADQVQLAGEKPLRADRLIWGPQDGELTILDRERGATVVDAVTFDPLRRIVADRLPTDLAFSPDGKQALWGNEAKSSSYSIEDLESGNKKEIEIGEHPGRLSFSPDGKYLAIGRTFWDPAAHGAGHSEVLLLDGEGKPLMTLEKSRPGAVHPVFSPNGKLLAVGNRNCETRLYEVATGKLLKTFDKDMIQEIAFSPDGKTLAAGYVDGDVALWNVETGEELRSAASGCEEIYSLAFSPSGDVLATSGRAGKIILWEAKRLTKLKELDAPYWVIQVRFSPDGVRLLSSSAADHSANTDRKITVWSIEGRER